MLANRSAAPRRCELLRQLDAEFRETCTLLREAKERGRETRDSLRRQLWLREAIRRFLVGDDAGARELLGQVTPVCTVRGPSSAAPTAGEPGPSQPRLA